MSIQLCQDFTLTFLWVLCLLSHLSHLSFFVQNYQSLLSTPKSKTWLLPVVVDLSVCDLTGYIYRHIWNLRSGKSLCCVLHTVFMYVFATNLRLMCVMWADLCNLGTCFAPSVKLKKTRNTQQNFIWTSLMIQTTASVQYCGTQQLIFLLREFTTPACCYVHAQIHTNVHIFHLLRSACLTLLHFSIQRCRQWVCKQED